MTEKVLLPRDVRTYGIDRTDESDDLTKRLPGLSTLSYSERLSILNLPTLEYKRLIADLVICFNIVHGFPA